MINYISYLKILIDKEIKVIWNPSFIKANLKKSINIIKNKIINMETSKIIIKILTT